MYNPVYTDRSFFIKALSLVQERTKKLSEVSGFLRFFFVEDTAVQINADLYTHSKMGTSNTTAPEALGFAMEIINTIPNEEWNTEGIKQKFMNAISEHGYKNGFVLYPLRVALSGEEFSPGTFELLEIFGKEKSIARIQNALTQLQ